MLSHFFTRRVSTIEFRILWTSQSIIDKGPELDIEIPDALKEVALSLLPYLASNPRTLKRFYNSLSLVYFFYICNRDKIGEINDVALGVWFFLHYCYTDEINEFLKGDKSTWDDLVGGDFTDNVSKINEFFIMFYKNKELDWLANKLEGETENISMTTRFLFLC